MDTLLGLDDMSRYLFGFAGNDPQDIINGYTAKLFNGIWQFLLFLFNVHVPQVYGVTDLSLVLQLYMKIT